MRKLDETLINYLTAFMWWVEVHTDYTAKRLGIWFDTAHHVFWILWAGLMIVMAYQNKKYAVIVICTLLLFVWVWLIAIKLLPPYSKYVYDEFRGCPNRARITRYEIRLFHLALTAIFMPFAYNLESACISLAVTSGAIGYYLLSCDEMPPSEKARRKARNEVRGMQGSSC
jgi:hypothetical protein